MPRGEPPRRGNLAGCPGASPAMTRWARRSGAPGEKGLDATPWEEMVSGPEGQGGRQGPLCLRKEQEKRKKKNRKKKDYRDEDVNGFAAYLKQSRQGGEAAGAGGAELEPQAAAAVRKDRRREERRLRRQEKKKNAMVSLAAGRGCLRVRGGL